jgi:hypothetical protein
MIHMPVSAGGDRLLATGASVSAQPHYRQLDSYNRFLKHRALGGRSPQRGGPPKRAAECRAGAGSRAWASQARGTTIDGFIRVTSFRA